MPIQQMTEMKHPLMLAPRHRLMSIHPLLIAARTSSDRQLNKKKGGLDGVTLGLPRKAKVNPGPTLDQDT